MFSKTSILNLPVNLAAPLPTLVFISLSFLLVPRSLAPFDSQKSANKKSSFGKLRTVFWFGAFGLAHEVKT
jgi:hypothetical protein